jgi:stage II sporulation protein D
MRARSTLLASVLAVFVATATSARADDTSASDKLRILYASRFTFTPDGLPLVTVEVMGGQSSITLSAASGLRVRPEGDGGSVTETAGSAPWVITAEKTTPATIHEWTVVETLGADDTAGVADAIERWTSKGFEPRAFEVGTLFGVDGEVIDTREIRIGIDPVPAPGGAARAAATARRFGVPATVHAELVQRPSGTIVARSGDTVVRNPSVVWLAPKSDAETLTVKNVVVGGGGSQLKTTLEDRTYWGQVYVTLDRDGKLVAVNAVPEDKLLMGLVPAEIFPDAPEAALEAQAIAARTELLGKLGKRSLIDPFMICSTQACQVYAGAGKEHPRTTKAVIKTRGQVLLRDGGGLVDIRYSASCGGHGEDNDHVWGGEADPSLRGRTDDAAAKTTPVTDDTIDEFLAEDPKDSWCGKAKVGGTGRFRWSERITAAALQARVAAEFPALGTVKGLVAKDRGVSGRIATLTIKGKSDLDVTGDLRIRRLLGGLKSTLFRIRTEGPAKAPTAYIFDGAGFGHGVGMCQMGAIGMAEAGKNRASILAHYYRGTHLHQIY